MTERFVSRQIRDGDNLVTLNIWVVENNGRQDIYYTLEPRGLAFPRRGHDQVPSFIQAA